MIQNETLHQTILQVPNDLDARLVYGDWLAEHDDPRGEFIQCEVAAEYAPKWSPQHADLYYQAELLGLNHRRTWNQVIEKVIETHQVKIKTRRPQRDWLGEYQYPNPVSYSYRVGFADNFEFTRLPKKEYLEALMEVTPLRKLKFTSFNNEQGLQFNSPLLKRVTQFDFTMSDHCRSLKNVLGPKSQLDLDSLRIYVPKRISSYLDSNERRSDSEMKGLAKLIASSNSLNHLRDFSINAKGFGVNEVKLLIGSPAFQNLKSLTLVEGDFGDEGFGVLLDSHLPSQLEYLKVKLTGIGDAGFKMLAEANPKNLHTLSMGWWYGSNPTIEGFSALTESPGLANLYFLDLSGWPINENCFTALCESNNLSSIKMLNLANTGMTDSMAELISQSPTLRLHYLDLEANPKLTRKGLTKILNSSVCKDLTWLNLRDNALGETAAKIIADSGLLHELRFLSLEQTELPKQSVLDLAKSNSLSKLRELNISKNLEFGSQVFRRLVESKNWPALQKVALRGYQIGDKSRKNLTERFGAGFIAQS